MTLDRGCCWLAFWFHKANYRQLLSLIAASLPFILQYCWITYCAMCFLWIYYLWCRGSLTEKLAQLACTPRVPGHILSSLALLSHGARYVPFVIRSKFFTLAFCNANGIPLWLRLLMHFLWHIIQHHRGHNQKILAVQR